MRILGLGEVSWLAPAPTAGKEPEKGVMPVSVQSPQPPRIPCEHFPRVTELPLVAD